MIELFEPAFLERQQAVYPDLDVRVYAGAVREMHGRRPVRNPNGLLVHWLRRAENARRARRAESSAAEAAAFAAERARYAALWVALLGLTASCALTPAQVAACLRTASQDGYTKLNPGIAEQLARLGQEWPEYSRAGLPVARPADQGVEPSHREV